MANQNTSYGQSLLRDILTTRIVGIPIENARPDWLHGLELDFYYPEHELAFEFQGDQHFVPVYGENTLSSQQIRDRQKRALCKQRGCVLVKVEAWELRHVHLKNKRVTQI